MCIYIYIYILYTQEQGRLYVLISSLNSRPVAPDKPRSFVFFTPRIETITESDVIKEPNVINFYFSSFSFLLVNTLSLSLFIFFLPIFNRD